MALAVYSIDSSALIHGWRRTYRPKNFGLVWDHFDVLIDQGRFRSSIEVYNELEKKDDELFKWCKERKDKMFVELDAETQGHVSSIMAKYPRLVDTAKSPSRNFSKGCIAFAASGGWTQVSKMRGRCG
jgi:hypothetical protein